MDTKGFLIGAVLTGLLPGLLGAEDFRLDLSTMESGPVPDEFFVVDGEFEVAEADGRKLLQIKSEPLAEALVLLGDTLKGGAMIRAKVRAEKRGRSYPRFGVGLFGISGYRLRVVPAQKQIEIYKDEEVIVKQPFEWRDGAWTWLELAVVSAGDGRWRVEGKVWNEGEEAPVQAPLIMEVEAERFSGKGVLSGTPYSGTPIQFDDVIVRGE